jgi:cytoskeletal protein RodZ
MLIAILVLLGIAGAIWYFARKQTHTVSLTAEQTAERDRQNERDAALAAAAVEPTSSISSPSVEQINNALLVDESAFTTPEVAAEKAFIQSQQDALAAAVVKAQGDLVEAKAAAELAETPKPAKKKRRYYPKKK